MHVSLLGEQAITDDRAGSIRGRSSRAVALIAFLVLHAGSAQARQRIAGLLWPEVHRCAGTDQPAPRTAPLAPDPGGRAIARGDVQGVVLA